MPAYQSAINNPDLFNGMWSGAGLKQEQQKMIELETLYDKQKNLIDRVIFLANKSKIPKEKVKKLIENILNTEDQVNLINAGVGLFLLEQLGDMDQKYFDDIISGRIITFNDDGKLYNQIKDLGGKERNFGFNVYKICA